MAQSQETDGLLSSPPRSNYTQLSGQAEQETSFVDRHSRMIKWSACIITLLFFIAGGSCFYACAPRSTKPMYNNGTHDYHPTVILISLDGVVSHDLVLHVTPHLSSLADKGGRAHWMTPSFPPITFPNHWSLVTGLYPEAHGIINNVFWDPVLNDTFNYKNPKQSWDVKWWGGEPIWSTVSRQGKKSGVIMWPGCSTSFPDGWQPSYVVPFQDGIPFDHKTDIALDWLDLPIQDRPQFIGLYVPEVDQAGHRYGPYANETLTQLNLADASIGRLVKQLEARNLTDIVQLMIVSDHGMSATDASRLIFYDDELTKDEMDLILVTEMAPNVAIWPQPNVDQEEAVGRLYDAFSRLRDVHGGDQAPFKVYKREDIPKRLHFRDNVRIPPLLVIPHPGWSIITHAEYDPAKDKVYHPRGAHGYDNLSPQSRAIFITHGPFWPAETIFYPFWNVELYHTIANILDVKPSANNGTTRGILPIES